MKAKFIKDEKKPNTNPVDFFNFYGSFVSIFTDNHKFSVQTEKEIIHVESKKVMFKLNKNNYVDVVEENEYDLVVNGMVSKFMLLTAVKFKKDYYEAMNYVKKEIMKQELPYIRVGGNYFKLIQKQDRYGGKHTLVKVWKKEEITLDHGKLTLKHIEKYDDFDIIPNNKEFIPSRNRCYNQYNKFPHQESKETINGNEIPYSLGIIKHIFGEQYELGLKYLKIIYEYPEQMLPILCLVSEERGTGKTTFLNWLHMIFGENSVQISPQDLISSFNSIYATKNIIMVDETIIEKSASVEKLKALATEKSITVNQKNVAEYSIPFFGKIILCTNKEKEFMRIDDDEIRFWVRKVNPVTELNTNIEKDLFNEIPKMLKYLSQQQEIDFSKSRMVFTPEEIRTNWLNKVVDESKSTLRKELELIFEDHFLNNDDDEIFVLPKFIKLNFFPHNNNYSIPYISKVLQDEMKLERKKMGRYSILWSNKESKDVGTPFIIKRGKIEKPENIKESIDNVFDSNKTPLDKDGNPF